MVDQLAGSSRNVTGFHLALGSKSIVTACRAHLSAALLWWLGFVAPTAATESFPLVLEHLTTADGLPQGTVYATLQDSQGFVWLATEDGLVRYDGHELVRYARLSTTRGGLSGNYIFQMLEDAHHDLWIAVKDGGVARWHRDTNSFTIIRHSDTDPQSLASDAVRALVLDARGRVWIGTSDAGIDILEPATGRIEHLRHDADNPTTLISDQILTLTSDSSGTVWAGTEEGLDRWLPQQRAFTHIRHEKDNPRSLSGNEISRVIEARDGFLWVGTFDGGLNRLDRAGQVMESFRHNPHDPDSLADDDVRAVLEDPAGRLWIGTADGLDLLDRASRRFSHHRHDAGDAESLRDSFIMSLYTDATGLMWIGTRAGGVSRWNPHSWDLGGYRPEWLRNRLVTAFADGRGDKVWVGTLGGGLLQFDPNTGAAVSVDTLTGQSNSVGDSRVMSLLQDRRGNLWIGTMANGLKKLGPDGQLQSIPVRPGDSHGLSAAGIMTIFETRSGQLWIGTHGGGVNVIDPTTALVRQLPFGAGAISAASVSAIAEDRSGNLWIGTDGGGLDLVRADGTVVKVFRHDPDNPATLSANTVYALAIDAQDRIWVGTDGGGLVRVIGSASSPDSIRFQTMSREQGLSSDTIYGVVADAGHIWLSGTAGLMRYEPEAGTLKTFHREHGLQGEEFNSGAYIRLRDGRLCFGGPGGFNLFDPARLTATARAPRLVLTRVEVMGVPTRDQAPYWLLDRVSLGYRDNIVSLDFGVLDFTSPRRNRLAYRMVGLTDRWIDIGTQHRITLTNLDAGDHLLEVRAANSDSVWSREPLRLRVHRDTSPWKSGWAYGAYALAVLILIAYRARLQRIRFERVVQEQQRLESEVAVRTRELVESNRQLEEAARVKSDFLDRMSHELRTPMNGVVGITELLARTHLSSTQARLTETIHSSAQVLLQVVNDLLDLSKINTGKIVLEELPVEPGRILEECASLFAGAAEPKGIDLIICPAAREPRNLYGDPLRVRQILMNLIGNAVKFTPHGMIVVRADVEVGDAPSATVHFSVSDTGIGMDSATLAKIFQPFTQADESTSRRFGGSGLGLTICRELAGLMGGSISVESQPQIGSTFRLSLPLKVGAEQPSREPAPLPSRRVWIVTRRQALAESLARHMSAFGLTSVCIGGDEPPPVGGQDDVIVVDVDDDSKLLDTRARFAPHAALVVVASAAAVQAAHLEHRLRPEAIVLKPVRREALYEALALATRAASTAANAAAILTADEPNLGGHVLLVEDEIVNAEVAQGYLAVLGCTSVWVKDGSAAIARNAAERFDLILMDLSMPGMDGFATTALIRQQAGAAGRIPIVALTAHDPVSYRDTCLQAGMNDMLSKPCTLEEYEQVLRRLIPLTAQERASSARSW
jgi:signal transduction histidine kinase/ligand-binding sensor domain-containing protein/CheY-like chemotaxis protein